jgi:hypothetical protein
MLIKELQDLQRQHGYRPREALHDLAERLNVLFFEVYGVASFLPHFRLNHPPAPSEPVPTCAAVLPAPKLSEPPCKWHVTVSNGLARLKARTSRRMTRGSVFVPFHSTCAGNVGQRAKRSCYEGEGMAEEDTRQLLRTFGVTVTNFEERTTQLLEQAKQLRQAGDSNGMLTLLKDFAGELLDLQRRWLDITNHTLSQQRRVLTEIATLVSEWGQKSG